MKYYITFGDKERIYNAATPHQACIMAFEGFMTHKPYVDMLPVAFRISEKGFEIHDEDEIIQTDEIIKLKALSNQCEV